MWKCWHMKYRIYSKYLDTLTPYHTWTNIGLRPFYYRLMCLQAVGCVTNSVDPDQTPRSAASDLGLHCLPRHICPSAYGQYCSINLIQTVHSFHKSISRREKWRLTATCASVETDQFSLVTRHEIFMRCYFTVFDVGTVHTTIKPCI